MRYNGITRFTVSFFLFFFQRVRPDLDDRCYKKKKKKLYIIIRRIRVFRSLHVASVEHHGVRRGERRAEATDAAAVSTPECCLSRAVAAVRHGFLLQTFFRLPPPKAAGTRLLGRGRARHRGSQGASDALPSSVAVE